MERTVFHVILSDTTGALWGAVLFFAFSLGVGCLTYGLARRLACMGSLNEKRDVGRGTAMVLGALIGAGAFVAFYASSLAGFYDLEVSGDHVVLHYLFPERYVTRPAVNLLKAEQEPAFKSRWRLVVHDVDGAVYQSALSSQQEVQKALALLHPVIESDTLVRP
jgi:hypothetical protein